MSDQNKKIMAQNIKRYMEKKGVTNQQLCDDLGFKYTTFMDWIKAVTYPRIGKVEAMANYFGCEKSDLIEDKSGSLILSAQDTPTPDFAKNAHEEDMLLLARHMDAIPDETREALKKQFKEAIDLYLAFQNKSTPEDQ